MTADSHSAVLEPPPAVSPTRSWSRFDLAAAVATVRETARRNPAEALALLHGLAARHALGLFRDSLADPGKADAVPLSAWSRSDPDGPGASAESLHLLQAGNRPRLAGRQPFGSTGSGEGSVLLLVRDRDVAGAGHLVLVEAGPELHVDAPIFDRDGFRQRWIEFAVPTAVEAAVALPAAIFRPGLLKAALVEELLHAALDLGLLEGFAAAAREHVTTRTRPWQGQSLAKATDDPHLLRRYGEYVATLHAVEGLVEEAGAAATGADLPTAIDAVASARAFSTIAGRSLISGTIELLGASATSERYGFDLFWRDFTAHAVGHPPLWPTETIGRRLALSAKEGSIA